MQGFNMGRYVPPDQEGLTSGNKLAKKHPLGARARHLHTKGALIVRFEMPFAVWCTTCKPHETLIGQGVRFNAEKKKVGSYHTTPIYSFRMKHTACGGWIEIRTDPQNTAYVVVEGGRKRDTGEDRELQPGEIAIRVGAAEADPAEKDPFAKIEGKVEDRRRARTESGRILELQERQSRDWDDPYAMSRRLRRTFRTERKGLERLEAGREALKEKMSLGIDLMDETEADRQRAGMVDFGEDQDAPWERAARVVRTRPMFSRSMIGTVSDASGSDRNGKKARQTRTVDAVGQRKAALRHELTGNTRAAVDPFLNDGDNRDVWRPGVKRKRPVPTGSVLRHDAKSLTEATDTSVSQKPEGSLVASPALVAYASDTD